MIASTLVALLVAVVHVANAPTYMLSGFLVRLERHAAGNGVHLQAVPAGWYGGERPMLEGDLELRCGGNDPVVSFNWQATFPAGRTVTSKNADAQLMGAADVLKVSGSVRRIACEGVWPGNRVATSLDEFNSLGLGSKVLFKPTRDAMTKSCKEKMCVADLRRLAEVHAASCKVVCADLIAEVRGGSANDAKPLAEDDVVNLAKCDALLARAQGDKGMEKILRAYVAYVSGMVGRIQAQAIVQEGYEPYETLVEGAAIVDEDAPHSRAALERCASDLGDMARRL